MCMLLRHKKDKQESSCKLRTHKDELTFAEEVFLQMPPKKKYNLSTTLHWLWQLKCGKYNLHTCERKSKVQPQASFR